MNIRIPSSGHISIHDIVNLTQSINGGFKGDLDCFVEDILGKSHEAINVALTAILKHNAPAFCVLFNRIMELSEGEHVLSFQRTSFALETLFMARSAKNRELLDSTIVHLINGLDNPLNANIIIDFMRREAREFYTGKMEAIDKVVLKHYEKIRPGILSWCGSLESTHVFASLRLPRTLEYFTREVMASNAKSIVLPKLLRETVRNECYSKDILNALVKGIGIDYLIVLYKHLIKDDFEPVKLFESLHKLCDLVGEGALIDDEFARELVVPVDGVSKMGGFLLSNKLKEKTNPKLYELVCENFAELVKKHKAPVSQSVVDHALLSGQEQTLIQQMFSAILREEGYEEEKIHLAIEDVVRAVHPVSHDTLYKHPGIQLGLARLLYSNNFAHAPACLNDVSPKGLECILNLNTGEPLDSRVAIQKVPALRRLLLERDFNI